MLALVLLAARAVAPQGSGNCSHTIAGWSYPTGGLLKSNASIKGADECCGWYLANAGCVEWTVHTKTGCWLKPARGFGKPTRCVDDACVTGVPGGAAFPPAPAPAPTPTPTPTPTFAAFSASSFALRSASSRDRSFIALCFSRATSWS